MKDNWDTKTAKDCKIKEVWPEYCKKCRDFDFCQKNRQISIDEYLEKMQDEWKLLPEKARIEFDGDSIFENVRHGKLKTLSLVKLRSPQKIQNFPDLMLRGTVNGVDAYIGLKQWVSGFNDEFEQWQPLQYKEIQK